MMGGAAVLIAAVGAMTAGQAITADDTQAATGAGTSANVRAAAAAFKSNDKDPAGAYVKNAAQVSLESRDATVVSRAGLRPGLSQTEALERAAREQAQARNEALRNVADNAEEYAEEIKKQIREERASNAWVLPTSYPVTTWFGEAGPYWSSGYHTGHDMAAPYGTPISSISPGVVTQVGWDGAYGNQVRVQLENGDEIWYNHMSSFDVVAGQTVTPGQQLGRVGDSGNTTGAHLHFEYRLVSDLSTAVDPTPYLRANGVTL